MLLELVYQSLYQAVNKMIQYWERFFDNLHETRENLLFEIQKRSKEFEGKTNPTNVYVLAEEKLQEKIWQDMRATFKFRCIAERYISRNLYEFVWGILSGCENGRDSIEKGRRFLS